LNLRVRPTLPREVVPLPAINARHRSRLPNGELRAESAAVTPAAPGPLATDMWVHPTGAPTGQWHARRPTRSAHQLCAHLLVGASFCAPRLTRPRVLPPPPPSPTPHSLSLADAQGPSPPRRLRSEAKTLSSGPLPPRSARVLARPRRRGRRGRRRRGAGGAGEGRRVLVSAGV